MPSLRALLPLCALALALLAAAPAATAQPADAPTIAAAEGQFESGLADYRAGNYDDAARRFTAAATDYGFNARTTAAYFMAGKAHYAAGDRERAVSIFASLLSTYPRSRYAEEARRLQQRALAIEDAPEPVVLGLVLPAGPDDRPLAQAMLNGVRLAVEQYNGAAPARPVQIVFRDTDGDAAGAQSATQSALDAGADLVIGPLYSFEAEPAAAVAERAGVPLVAPLATEEAVAAGRRFVFQVNPPFAERARVIARYATDELGLQALGTIAEPDGYGRAMADAFTDEARAREAEVPLDFRLASARDWFRLPDVLQAEMLAGLDALYLPTVGDQAAEHAAASMRGLEEIGVVPRPLGNEGWDGLQASRARAAKHQVVFTEAFHVDGRSPDAARFQEAYLRLAGAAPDRLAYAGYDTATFLLGVLRPLRSADGLTGQRLADAIRQAPRHDGLGHRLHFAGGQVNEALFLLGYGTRRYADGRPAPVD